MIIDKTLLGIIQEISIDAGAAIMKVYNESGDMDVVYKTDRDDSPLTKADTDANDVIKLGLEKLDNSIPILSEEMVAEDYEVRKHWKRFWLLDPLDGTKEFIKKSKEFTVNIALIEDGVPILGVVYAPALNICYSGASGVGAFKSEGGAEKEIVAGNYEKDGLKVVASKSHRSPELEEFIGKIGDNECVAMGSSLKLCLVADGSANLYPRFGPTMEWDTGAAHAVVEASGGEVTDFEGNRLRYNKEDLHNPFFMVSGKPAFDWKKCF